MRRRRWSRQRGRDVLGSNVGCETRHEPQKGRNMKSHLVIALLAAVLVMPVAFGEAPAPKMISMDVSDGKSEGHIVAFGIRAAREGAPMGLAVAVPGHQSGEDWGPGFGMIMEGARPVAKSVPAEDIEAVITAEGDVRPVVIYVAVTSKQHADVKTIVAKWGAIEEHIDDASNVTMNFAQEVLDALGMKRPYRSGLGGSNAVQYMGDIPAFNRTSIVEESD